VPLNCEPILAAARKANGKILVVEDNFVGGFYSAIAEAAAQAGDVKVFGLTCPRIPKSGKTGDIILEALGLGPAAIAEKARSLR
jgi:transketolase C-terminal domain/subunit